MVPKLSCAIMICLSVVICAMLSRLTFFEMETSNFVEKCIEVWNMHIKCNAINNSLVVVTLILKFIYY